MCNLTNKGWFIMLFKLEHLTRRCLQTLFITKTIAVGYSIIIIFPTITYGDTKNRPDRESDVTLYCQCKVTKKFYEARIAEEKLIGARTGFVDQQKLYKSGQMLVKIDAYLGDKGRILGSEPNCPDKAITNIFNIQTDLTACGEALYREELRKAGYE